MLERTLRNIVQNQEIIAAPSKTSVADAARLMKQHKIGAILVVDDNQLVGIFTERDGLYRVVAEQRDVRKTSLSEVMTPNPQSVHPDDSFPRALHLMHTGGFRHVPVVDNGAPIGIVSARDALGPELEDFVYALLRQDQVGDILA